MKELMSVSSNVSINVYPDAEIGPCPMVELVLVLSKPKYSLDATGELVKSRQTLDVRFSTTPNQLKKMAAILIKTAEEAQKDCDRVLRSTLKPKQRTLPDGDELDLGPGGGE